MESLEEASSDSGADAAMESARDGTLRRIASQTQELLSDLRTWIDLRLDLALLEVEERIDALRNELALGLTVVIFGFFAALFSLATVAIGVGWLLGHPFWGFLAVSVALILVVVILQITQPALVPPSNLLRAVRGEQEAESDDERPARPASVAVGEDGAEGESSDSTTP